MHVDLLERRKLKIIYQSFWFFFFKLGSSKVSGNIHCKCQTFWYFFLYVVLTLEIIGTLPKGKETKEEREMKGWRTDGEKKEDTLLSLKRYPTLSPVSYGTFSDLLFIPSI